MTVWPAVVGDPDAGELDIDHVMDRWQEIEEDGTAIPTDCLAGADGDVDE